MTLRRRSRPLVAGLLALVLALPSAHAQLPSLGDGNDMTPATERRLGERIARELYRDPDYIDDPVLVDYVRGIWQPLLEAARARGELTPEMDERYAWQVLLGKDRSVNAFALPGGWLGLHSGLVAITTTPDELASVLAHELSHVTQRHIARIATQEKRNAPLVIGAMILGALAAAKSPQAASAVMSGSQAAAIQGQLNFSRDMEREADRVGYGVLMQAGFEPQGFVTMFEKLGQASRLNDTGNFPYLRTHPLTTERVADMQARQQLAARPAPATGPRPTLLLHALMAGRARVLSNLNVDGLRTLVAEGSSAGAATPGPRRLGALYAGALAASRARDHATARQLAQRLASEAGSDPVLARQVRWLDAELALAAGDAARAAGLVDATATSRPDMLLWAQARLAAGDPAPVAQRLQTWVTAQPRDALAWQTLAGAYAAQNLPLRTLRAQAEAQVAQLDYPAALDRFKAAQELARRSGADHIEASIIDTRLRQVESLLREQALER